MKTLKYQTYELKYKNFPLEYSLIKGKNVESQSHDYSKDYLTFKALEDGTFSFTKAGVNYSIDGGKTWTELAANTSTPTVSAGETIMFKATLIPVAYSGIGKFSSTSSYEVMGNPYSLLYGDNFATVTSLFDKDYALFNLFSSSTGLTSAENLSLPATTLAESCYSNMFNGCKSLITVPELPAITLARSCYGNMFYDCKLLTAAPALPATTLANNCYFSMFYGCKALTSAPELPATTLATYCYQQMFSNCTSLTTAPILPATTLVEGCYNDMFYKCTSLTYIKAMFTTIPSSDYTQHWVNGVSPTGTFVKNSTATWDVTGDNGIPTGWTVETADAAD